MKKKKLKISWIINLFCHRTRISNVFFSLCYGPHRSGRGSEMVTYLYVVFGKFLERGGSLEGWGGVGAFEGEGF